MDGSNIVYRLSSIVEKLLDYFGLPALDQCLQRFEIAIGDLLNRIGVEQIGFVCQRSVQSFGTVEHDQNQVRELIQPPALDVYRASRDVVELRALDRLVDVRHEIEYHLDVLVLY